MFQVVRIHCFVRMKKRKRQISVVLLVESSIIIALDLLEFVTEVNISS